MKSDCCGCLQLASALNLVNALAYIRAAFHRLAAQVR
jgi:hypothetical protein